MKSKKIFFVLIFLSIFHFIACSDREGISKHSNITGPSTPPNLVVESPSNGDILRPGLSYQIKWSFPTSIQKVTIQLWRKREFKSIIANAYSNTGNYNWKIPQDILNSIHYRIKICDYDSPDFEATSNYFAVLIQ
jgi:hypothetical protein